MIKYDALCCGVWLMIGKPIVKLMANKRNLKRQVISKRMKQEYKTILMKTDDIKGSPLRFNLIWGCIMLAIPRVFNDVSDKEFEDCLYLQFSNEKFLKAMRKGRNVFKDDKPNKRLEQHSSALTNDWEYMTDRTNYPHELKRIYKRCGLYSLCKQENMLHYLPLFCKLDYIMYTKGGCELIRTQTLSNEDEHCCFRFINSQYQDVHDVMKRENISSDQLV